MHFFFKEKELGKPPSGKNIKIRVEFVTANAN